MVSNQNSVQPGDDGEISTAYTATTPPSSTNTYPGSINTDFPTLVASSVPWPGSTYIIRSAETGKVLTLLDGAVKLSPPGSGHGSIHWTLEEHGGWYGFRNNVSGNLLGHDGPDRRLYCKVRQFADWEKFMIVAAPGGGYVLLMTHWRGRWAQPELQSVRVKVEEDVEKLWKGEGSVTEGSVWEFVKV